MPLGFSFQPGATNNIPVNPQTNPQTTPGTGSLPQGAARILSLRIPRNVGPSPIAPRQLLMSPGAQGSPDLNALIGMLLRTMQPPAGFQGGLGGGALQGAGTSFPSGTTPRIIPGQEGQGGASDYNPYLDPGNYAPIPENPPEPLQLPAPTDYHFGETPPETPGSGMTNPYLKEKYFGESLF